MFEALEIYDKYVALSPEKREILNECYVKLGIKEGFGFVVDSPFSFIYEIAEREYETVQPWVSGATVKQTKQDAVERAINQKIVDLEVAIKSL